MPRKADNERIVESVTGMTPDQQAAMRKAGAYITIDRKTGEVEMGWNPAKADVDTIAEILSSDNIKSNHNPS